MIHSRTDTESESLVNEEVNVETIEINSSNIRDLHVPSAIAPVVTPKALSHRRRTTRNESSSMTAIKNGRLC
jgi:hypothetical protein